MPQRPDEHCTHALCREPELFTYAHEHLQLRYGMEIPSAVGGCLRRWSPQLGFPEVCIVGAALHHPD